MVLLFNIRQAESKLLNYRSTLYKFKSFYQEDMREVIESRTLNKAVQNEIEAVIRVVIAAEIKQTPLCNNVLIHTNHLVVKIKTNLWKVAQELGFSQYGERLDVCPYVFTLNVSLHNAYREQKNMDAIKHQLQKLSTVDYSKQQKSHPVSEHQHPDHGNKVVKKTLQKTLLQSKYVSVFSDGINTAAHARELRSAVTAKSSLKNNVSTQSSITKNDRHNEQQKMVSVLSPRSSAVRRSLHFVSQIRKRQSPRLKQKSIIQTTSYVGRQISKNTLISSSLTQNQISTTEKHDNHQLPVTKRSSLRSSGQSGRGETQPSTTPSANNRGRYGLRSDSGRKQTIHQALETQKLHSKIQTTTRTTPLGKRRAKQATSHECGKRRSGDNVSSLRNVIKVDAVRGGEHSDSNLGSRTLRKRHDSIHPHASIHAASNKPGSRTGSDGNTEHSGQSSCKRARVASAERVSELSPHTRHRKTREQHLSDSLNQNNSNNTTETFLGTSSGSLTDSIHNLHQNNVSRAVPRPQTVRHDRHFVEHEEQLEDNSLDRLVQTTHEEGDDGAQLHSDVYRKRSSLGSALDYMLTPFKKYFLRR